MQRTIDLIGRNSLVSEEIGQWHSSIYENMMHKNDDCRDIKGEQNYFIFREWRREMKTMIMSEARWERLWLFIIFFIACLDLLTRICFFFAAKNKRGKTWRRFQVENSFVVVSFVACKLRSFSDFLVFELCWVISKNFNKRKSSARSMEEAIQY